MKGSRWFIMLLCLSVLITACLAEDATTAQLKAGTLPAAMPAQCPTMVFQIGQSGSYYDHMRLSPDGTRLAACSNDEVVIWDLTTGLIVNRLSHRDLLSEFVAFSPDNRFLFCSTHEDGYYICDIDTGRWQQVLQSIAEFGIFFPDGKHLVSVQHLRAVAGTPFSDQMTLRDVQTGDEICRGLVAGCSISWSDDGTHYAIFNGNETQPANGGMVITQGKILDLQSGTTIDLDCGSIPVPIQGAWLNPNGIFSPDGRRFAGEVSVQEKLEVLIWDSGSGKLLNVFPTPTAMGYSSLALSADGAKLAYAGNDGAITIYDVASGKQSQLRQEQDHPRELCFTPDGKSLLALQGFQQPAVRIFDLATGQMSRQLSIPPLIPGEIVASHDGRLLAAGTGRSVMLWDLTKGQVIRDFPLPSRADYTQPVMSPDGRLLAVIDVSGVKQGNNGIQVFDAGTGELKQTLAGHFLTSAFSPDDTMLAAGSDDGAISIWHLGDRTAATPVREHGMVSEIAFSPDGTKLAWICYAQQKNVDHLMPNYAGGSRLIVWNLPADTRITEEAGKENHFANLSFSPNGRWVMATRTGYSPRSMVCCWDAATGKLVSLPHSAGELIRFAQFSPDDAQLIGESNGRLLIWDLRTGHLEHVVKISDERIRDLCFAGKDTFITRNDENAISLLPARRLLSGIPAKAFVTLYTFYKDSWLAVSSQSYFDCSPAATKLFRWQYQGKLYPYEQFEQQYHQPELLRKALIEGESLHAER